MLESQLRYRQTGDADVVSSSAVLHCHYMDDAVLMNRGDPHPASDGGASSVPHFQQPQTVLQDLCATTHQELDTICQIRHLVDCMYPMEALSIQSLSPRPILFVLLKTKWAMAKMIRDGPPAALAAKCYSRRTLVRPSSKITQ